MFSKSENFRANKVLCADGLKLRCSVDREMDVSTSALVDDGVVAECLSGLFCAFDYLSCSCFLFYGFRVYADSCCLQKKS